MTKTEVRAKARAKIRAKLREIASVLEKLRVEKFATLKQEGGL